MNKLKIQDVLKATNGRLVNDTVLKAMDITGISIDSRKIEKGQLFIPIVGERFDGHDFISDVYNKGAAITLVSNVDKLLKNQPAIIVFDTKKALIDLAKYYRNSFDIPIIAITGSVGKTSCKEMVASVLSTKYKVHKTKGNFNNDIGLPLSILDMPSDTQIAIFEMGMNHYGEIDLLSSIAKPTHAIITNIGVSHIEYFGSKEGILKAKSEILNHLKENSSVILNGDDEYLRKLENNVTKECIYFGFEFNNTYYIKSYNELGFDGIKATIKGVNDTYEIVLNVLGKHMLYYALVGVILGERLGLKKEEIIEGISNYKNEKMRLNKEVLNNGITIINDAYNASVDSMKSALELLKSIQSDKRKIAILGDMFEMGSYAEEGHNIVGNFASRCSLDLLICVGKSARWIYMASKSNMQNVMYFETKKELLDVINSLIKPQDIILVKASRGMKLEDTIEKIKEVD